MNTQTRSRSRLGLLPALVAMAALLFSWAGPASAQPNPPAPAKPQAPAAPAAPAAPPAVVPAPVAPTPPVAPFDLGDLDIVLSPETLASLKALELDAPRLASLAELNAYDMTGQAFDVAASAKLAESRAFDALARSGVQERLAEAAALAGATLPRSYAEAQLAYEQARKASSEADIKAAHDRVTAAEEEIRALEKQVQDAQQQLARAQGDEATRKTLEAKRGQLRAAQERLRVQQAKMRELERETSRVRAYTVLRGGNYERGVSDLDAGRWQRAIESFDEVIKSKDKRADGALYWKAYAQNRLGQRAEALATLQELQKSYSTSRWMNDAKALDVEVRQSMGQPVRPGDLLGSDDDLKLIALNNVMMSDPDRGIPIVEKLLQGTASPSVKKQALFLLAQTGSAKARDVLVQVAKGSGNPDLQIQAVRYLGMFGRGWSFRGASGTTPFVYNNRRSTGTAAAPSVDTAQALADIYNATADVDVKREILRSFMMSRDKDRLLALAKTEKNPDLRAEAVRQLGMMGAQSELFSLYGTDLSSEVRQQIISAMVMSRSADQLLQIARSEKDAALKAQAIKNLGMLAGTRGFVFNGEPFAMALPAPAPAPAPMPATPPPAPGVKQPVPPAPPAPATPPPTAVAPAIVGARTGSGLDPAEVTKIGDGLVSIYKSDKDASVRKAVVNSLFMMQNAKALVDIARAETDPAMKKDLVQKLSVMKSKEATDYMLELLK